MNFEIELSQALVSEFVRITGDASSLHTDPQFARKTQFRQRIAHGMLPLVLLLGRASCHQYGDAPAFLKEISCRFVAPIKIGERVTLESTCAERNGQAEKWDLSVRCTGDREVAISANATFIRTADTWEPDHRPADALLTQPIVEAVYRAEEISVGIEDRIKFSPNPSALRPLFDLLRQQLGSPPAPDKFSSSNVTALSMLSTFIGMRLPGQHATFVGFRAEFYENVRDPETVLEGKVVAVQPAINRVKLGLTWDQAGRTVGKATATAIVRAGIEEAISCSSIISDHMPLGIGGRVALVTGASRGIGEATAKALAMSGAAVGVHFFRGADDAQNVVQDIREHNGTAIAVQADLSDSRSINVMFNQIEETLGPVSILVNNAVVDATPRPVERIGTRDFLDELNVSLIGMHECCQRVLPHMKRQRWGKIINLGTIATEFPLPYQTKYIAVKSAVVGYTRSLAFETAGDNIQVNVVMPGMTKTSLIEAMPPDLLDRAAKENPSASLVRPIDVAKVILFLASDWARNISGQKCVLNSGAPPYV